MTQELKRLQMAFSEKERAEKLLSNLEGMKKEGTIDEGQYESMKNEYTLMLNKANAEIEQIKNDIKTDLENKQRDLDIYNQELKNLEVRFKVGELQAEAYLKSERRMQGKIEKTHQKISGIKKFFEAQSSADVGGYIDDISIKKGNPEEGNIAKDIISILFKPSSIREIVANRTVADGIKFFIAVSMLYWLVGTVINVSKFGNEGLLLLLLYPAADFCLIFAFAALIGYFYSRKGYEADHTNVSTCIFYSSVPALVFFWLEIFEDSIVYWPTSLVGICWSMYLLIKALGAYLDNQYENIKTVVYSFLLFWGVVFIVVIIAGVITGLFFGIDIFEGSDFAEELLSSILIISTCLLIGVVFSTIKPSEMIRHEITERPAGVRPFGVTVIAIISLIVGMIWLFGSLYTQDVRTVLIGGLLCIAAYGLLKLQNWGRWVFFITVFLFIFFIFIDMFSYYQSRIDYGAIVGGIFGIWYLMKPEIKAQFT